MSKPIITTIAEENQFSNFIVFENGKYIAFGKEPFSDLVKIGSAKKVKTNSVYLDGEILGQPESKSAGLYDKIHELYDPALIGSLRIQSYQVKFIQKTIKLFNATHIKFYGNENGIFVNFFDILRSIPEARMNRKHETRLLVHQLKNVSSKSFEMTFNAGTFKILPASSYHIGLGDNKVVIFTDDDADVTYLLRDPEVIQPVINFFSKGLNQNITLTISPQMSLITSSLDNDESESESDPSIDYQEV